MLCTLVLTTQQNLSFLSSRSIFLIVVCCCLSCKSFKSKRTFNDSLTKNLILVSGLCTDTFRLKMLLSGTVTFARLLFLLELKFLVPRAKVNEPEVALLWQWPEKNPNYCALLFRRLGHTDWRNNAGADNLLRGTTLMHHVDRFSLVCP